MAASRKPAPLRGFGENVACDRTNRKLVADRPVQIPLLPLVCLHCLRSGRPETRLRDMRCPSCGTTPLLRGNTVDFDAHEEGERHRFYHEEESYLREVIAGEDPTPWLTRTDSLGGLVLEIGSGSGARAGTGGSDYVALDYSATHLRRLPPDTPGIRASAEQIPLATRSCRFIFTIATLEHVPDPALAFAEIDRLLVPGGIAYVSPAWHCRPWAAEGLPVRPYRELNASQKIRKALIPLRDSLVWRGLFQIPWRVYRRVVTAGQRPSLAWEPLAANYETFWMSDSDACARIDSHEGVIFFERRGYEILRPAGSVMHRLFFRAGPLIVRKPV